MDKGFTVQKWVLVVWPKIPQQPQNLSAQFVSQSPKVLDFNEKTASLGVRSPWYVRTATARPDLPPCGVNGLRPPG